MNMVKDMVTSKH